MVYVYNSLFQVQCQDHGHNHRILNSIRRSPRCRHALSNDLLCWPAHNGNKRGRMCSCTPVTTRDLQIADIFFFRTSPGNVHTRASKYFRGEMQMHPPVVIYGLVYLKKSAMCKIPYLSRTISISVHSRTRPSGDSSESHASMGFTNCG